MNDITSTPDVRLISEQRLRAAVAAGDIHTVTPAVVDMWGYLKGKHVAADTFLDQLDNNAPGEACAYILASDVGMVPTDTYALTGWSQGFQDMRMRPDLKTIRFMPHTPGVALVHCDAVDSTGEPIEVAPRQILRRQLEQLESYGYQVRIGWEHEFKLLRDGRPLTPASGDYALNHHPLLSTFIQWTEAALFAAGTPMEAFKSEGAPGQMEVTFPYGPAMRACDNYTVYRQTLQHIAEERGWSVNFMAAPETGEGSGLHLHLSLWKDGEPVFADDGSEDLPDPLSHALGGLLCCMPHLGPLWAPFPNSYKRFQQLYKFAPQFMNWGYDHRGCAVRMTGHGRGRHQEIRLAGADANPYLVAATACASIYEGLTNKFKPSPPCTGDAYSDLISPRVHRDLAEALRHFNQSDFAVKAFGDQVVDHYAAAAQYEIDHHNKYVTDVERERGGSRA